VVLNVGACLSRFTLSNPVPNKDVNALDSLPSLLAAVLSGQNGRTVISNPHNQDGHSQRQVTVSQNAPNSLISPKAFQRSSDSSIQIVHHGSFEGSQYHLQEQHAIPLSIGQHGASISQGVLNKRIQDSRESFEDFRISQRNERVQASRESLEDLIIPHRNEPLKVIPTKSTALTSSKPVYFNQGTVSAINNLPKRKIQQKSNLPLFLVLKNYGHPINKNIKSKKQKVTNTQGTSEYISNESDLSLFLPVITDDEDSESAEFRKLSIPSQLLPEFKNLNNHRPIELVEDLHGYVFDINKEDSQNLISFLKQSNLESLESLESREQSSSSEEEYLQGRNNFDSRESDEDSDDDRDEISVENSFRQNYSEEDVENKNDDGGEKSSVEVADMVHFITTRKKQDAFATSRPLYLGSPAIGSTIVPTFPHYSLTTPPQMINKGQTTRRFSLRTVSSKEISYEDSTARKKNFHLPNFTYKVKTQEQNYAPISSVRSLSQALSSEFVRRVPKLNTFPSSPGDIKSTPGVGSGSIRLIPSVLHTGAQINHGISGVLGLGQPVSVGLLQ
ncbi:unnamed protein product, partial [Meganyctiphanes norvegica]